MLYVLAFVAGQLSLLVILAFFHAAYPDSRFDSPEDDPRAQQSQGPVGLVHGGAGK